MNTENVIELMDVYDTLIKLIFIQNAPSKLKKQLFLIKKYRMENTKKIYKLEKRLQSTSFSLLSFSAFRFCECQLCAFHVCVIHFSGINQRVPKNIV